ncbi:MAG: ABC transporter ATP-binding protein [Planctomycetes bacterium]|nr:ABC transporter ATP-binding protein [Planctomycetota bacterium]MBT4560088.1 ABC transporter ATP-binding protein [Planctomycetota bacterium]MBT5102264.1 ABC transporter ATP-binding protein [Planctomycetota bacterium]MBT5120357.1 ABC transporter ATP-binding protein [Planctomycetota bacterium]
MIRAQSLSKTYGKKTVLREVSIQIQNGEILGLVGPNGAGKTTFLKCLLGIARADSGQAQIDSFCTGRQSLAARKITGFAPSVVSLYDNLNAVQTLQLAIHGYPAPKLQVGLDLFDAFQLPRQQAVGKFSHGMKRKLLLVCALAANTPNLVLDEPMEGLDPEARRFVESLLTAEAQSGRCILFSSHDLASVERICQSVAFLRDGLLLEQAPLAEILDRASRHIQLSFREPLTLEQLPQHENLQWSGQGLKWSLRFQGPTEKALAMISSLPIASLRDSSAGLEDVFEALYRPELST